MKRDLLTLTQWLSPAFPLGSFAYSNGLEQVITDGKITDAMSLQSWLTGLLRFGSARVDVLLLLRARRGEAVAGLAQAICASKERWIETSDQGMAFATTLRSLGYEIEDAPLPVAVGRASRDLDLSGSEVASLYLHSMMSNLVSCAVRFVPLGQADGQRCLAALHDEIVDCVERLDLDDPRALGSASLLGDIASMRHEFQEVRIFRT